MGNRQWAMGVPSTSNHLEANSSQPRYERACLTEDSIHKQNPRGSFRQDLNLSFDKSTPFLLSFLPVMIAKASIGLLVGATSFLKRPLHLKRNRCSDRQIYSKVTPTSNSLFGTNSIASEFEQEEIKSDSNISTFDPLGPPEYLASLRIGDSISVPHPFGGEHDKVNIKRLSRHPDIFLLQNYLSYEKDRLLLQKSAQEQGLKVAGTKKSNDNAVRKNSYLTWIDPDHIESEENLGEIVHHMGKFANEFVHESLRKEKELYELESLQVAKYNEGGRFDEHHDDFGRFLTVLSYLNGIGGTYFQYAQTSEEIFARGVIDGTNIPGRNGLLVVGKEGHQTYFPQDGSDEMEASAVVQIEPGDAVAFYNYHVGEKNMKSVHASLPVPVPEKWIATNWMRSEQLTGSFGYLHHDQLQAHVIKN